MSLGALVHAIGQLFMFVYISLKQLFFLQKTTSQTSTPTEASSPLLAVKDTHRYPNTKRVRRRISQLPKHFVNSVEQNPYSIHSIQEGWSHTTTPHSCQHCARVVVQDGDVKRHETFKVKLPHTIPEAVLAASEGCPLFAIICDELDYTSSPTRPISHALKYLRKRPFSLNLNWSLEEKIYKLSIVRSYQWPLRALLDPAATEMDPYRIGNSYLPTDQNFALCKHWLNECLSYHENCRTGESSFVPARLLRINLDNPEGPLTLVDDTSTRDSLNWCALSYVWGGDQPLKLTKSNLQSLKDAISPEQLPNTLRDAVIVSRALGIEYLWIDCLCIIQDDPADLTIQLATMAKVYQQATVTLSASSANNVRGGFLQNRGYYYLKIPPVKIKYVSTQNILGDVLMIDGLDSDVSDPINTRAWTYQERLLSPRLIDFTTKRVKWVCIQGQVDEHLARPDIDYTPCSRSHSMTPWTSVVGQYYLRELSYPADTLKAISAIAEFYKQDDDDVYLAGLWKHDLIAQLCWRHTTHPKKPRPSQYRAPSWSWAAIDTWKYALLYGSDAWEECEAKVVEAMVTQDIPSTTFSNVRGGHITINGKTQTCSWAYNKKTMHVNGRELWCYADAEEAGWDKDDDATVETLFLLLAKSRSHMGDLVKCGLILVPVAADTYRRVGFFDGSIGKDDIDFTDIAHSFATRTVTIV